MHSKTPTSAGGFRRYLTTAIPYVNAAPHVGFALEMVQADALARFYRLAGDDVRFQAGTDENSIKNVQAADLAGVPVAQLVEWKARLNGSLFSLAAALQTIATGIAPLLPQTSQRLTEKLGAGRGDAATSALVGRRVEKGLPLFPKP